MSDFSVNNYIQKLDLDEDFFLRLTHLIKRGNNSLLQNRLAETMIVDNSWIDEIAKLLYSVEKIVKNPQEFIREDEIIVPVEKVKKTTSETMRHLSSHSNLIRNIDDNGNVIPIKLLTKEYNEDIAIYENRFVFTLINRLLTFVEQKYAVISKQVDAYDTTNLKMNSQFELNKASVEYNLEIKVKGRAKTNLTAEHNVQLLKKLEDIRKRIIILKASNFCGALANVKPVLPPIIKTNLLTMHIDYKNSYKLWLFISSYTSVGFSVDLAEKSMPIDNDYYDDLTTLIAVSLKTMIGNNAIRDPMYKRIKFKKRAEKKFKVIRDINLTTSYENAQMSTDEDLINQYYYDKIKEALNDKDKENNKNIIANKYNININFRKLFKNINKINNEIYDDILKVSKYENKATAENTSLKKKEIALKQQEELYNRYKLLSKLKFSELDSSLKRESEQLVKLEKIRFECEQLHKKFNKKKRLINKNSIMNLKNNDKFNLKEIDAKYNEIFNRKTDLIESATVREIQMLSDERTREALLIQKEKDKKFEQKRLRQQKTKEKLIESDKNKINNNIGNDK